MATKIEVAFDPGTSITKCIYRVNGEIHPLLMEPEVMELPAMSIEQHTHLTAGVATPMNSAWLKVRRRDPYCIAVGLLAREFRASVSLNRLKYEDAVAKLLAAIGVIVQREAIEDEVIQVSVAALLPLGEFSDRERFEQQLGRRLRSFYFRDQLIRAELADIYVMPEGSGFAFNLLREFGERWFAAREAVCCLMLGHRNSSLLIFRNGRIDLSASSTSDLGFVQLVDKVIERSSGQDRRSLTRVLYELDDDPSPDNPLLKSLAKSRQSRNIKREVCELSRVVQVARQEYWQLVKGWIEEFLPTRVDYVCIGGGASYYLRHPLNEFLGWSDPAWVEPADMVSHIAEELEDPSLRRRLGDVWSVFYQYFFGEPNLKNSHANSHAA